MTSDDLTRLTIKDALRLLRLGSISSADLVTAHVDRIERLDPKVKAYLRFTPELWEKQADEADRKIRQGEGGPLAGIPIAVKDVLCVRGVETTAGSRRPRAPGSSAVSGRPTPGPRWAACSTRAR